MEVGKVAGTADSTPLKFHVAIADGAYLQLDDVVTCSPRRPRCREGRHLRRRDRGRLAPRGRHVRLRRVPDRRRRHARPGAGGRRGHHHPRRPRVLRARRARVGGPPGDRRGPRPGAVLRPDGRQGPRRPRPRRRSRSTSTSSSSTALAARTCRSPASPASRPRPASRCSCCTRCSPLAPSGHGPTNAKALIFSVKGEDLLFLDQPNIKLDRHPARQVRAPRPARGAVRLGRLLLPARCPATRPAART